MLVDVVMPKMGESIQEGKILRWMKQPGEKIAMDESILEISTDKVDSEIPSPVAGFLSKIVIPEGETVEVGTVIAVVDTDAASVNVAQPVHAPTVDSLTSVSSAPAPQTFREVVHDRPVHKRNGERFYSPLVRTIAKKEGIALQELEEVEGTGIAGRVTKRDLEVYLKNRTARHAPHDSSSIHPVGMDELRKKYPSPHYDIVQMDNVQLKMAEHMVRSVRTSPHVEAVSECDLTKIAEFRSSNADRFEKQEGFKLTYMPFFVDAAVDALKGFPLVNSSVEGDKIIVKKSINIGMAVAAPHGLFVPVLKDARDKSFIEIARTINDLAIRTRSKRLLPEEIQGGTFTITNYGVFGNIIGTPIINQPQVAILGLGAVTKRPVVVSDAQGKDSIAIRSMAYLTLAFDHRIIDGALGGQFLSKIVSNLEQYDLTKVF